MSFPSRYLFKGFAATLPRADSVGFFDRAHENLPVSNFSCFTGLQNGFHGHVHEIVIHDDAQEPALDVRGAIVHPAVHFSFGLVTNSRYVPIAKEVHVRLMQRFSHLVKLGFSDDCFYFFHFTGGVALQNYKFESLDPKKNRGIQVKKLNKRQKLDAIITSVQEIPYYLVHENSCSVDANRSSFSYDYHRSGQPS